MSKSEKTTLMMGRRRILPFEREGRKELLDRRQEQELMAAMVELLISAARSGEGEKNNDR